MSKTLRLRSARAALIVAGLLAVAMCASPVLGAPGPLSALVLGAILPPFFGAVGARIVDSQRGLPVGELVQRGVTCSWLTLGLVSSILLLNMVRAPVCDPWTGFAFLVLGPGMAMTMAVTAGVLIGAFVPRVRAATTLGVLVPIAAAAVELGGFYATPAIYAYGHFFGYFPGALYDPDITVGVAYLSYRALSFVWWAAMVCGLACTWDPESRRARVSVTRARWPLAALTLLLTTAGIAGEAEGWRAGHFSTPESIAEALGGRLEGRRCIVIYPRETPRAEARRLADDCDFRVRRVEQLLGVRQPAPVTALFFRSTEEKRALMGASTTYIAKPWRNEVYLQVSEWPHPVLFHEIVHVVAGNIGAGPFRVACSTGGVIPAPGIIEGVAVALAWDAREGLTPHQWARAMLELELTPPLRAIEGLGFLLHPASQAYTASGSFVRWMLETQGPQTVRRLYLSGDFDVALGRPLEEAEAEWLRFLREEVELPEEARAMAQLRFERPGIFSSICPHAIANLRHELGADLSAGDDDAAVTRCQEILSLDPGQAVTRATLVGALARLARDAEAESHLDRLLGPPSAATPVIARAQQERADALWQRGRSAEARTLLEQLRSTPMTTDGARQIEVRQLAIDAGGEQEAALRELLAPRRGVMNDPATQMFAIERLDDARDDGLAPYLSARQMLFRRRFGLALPEIEAARRRGLPTVHLQREARRMDAVIRFGAGEYHDSAQLWREVLRDPSSTEGERVVARDWLARIRDVGRTATGNR